MDTSDKLGLLFLAGSRSTRASDWNPTLPTFATLNIEWGKNNYHSVSLCDDQNISCNFDLDSISTIQLLSVNVFSDNISGCISHKIRLKPKMYYTLSTLPHYMDNSSDDEQSLYKERRRDIFHSVSFDERLLESLKIDRNANDFTMVIIPMYYSSMNNLGHLPRDPPVLKLSGSFTKNKWILHPVLIEIDFPDEIDLPDQVLYEFHSNESGSISFDIY
jgi:hypothetical protein